WLGGLGDLRHNDIPDIQQQRPKLVFALQAMVFQSLHTPLTRFPTYFVNFSLTAFLQRQIISLISVFTEIKEITMNLSATAQKFILHWGEMGTRWGVNRTVAQIHALLYLSPQPLNADDIVETLGVARSNVSNSLHE